MDTDTEATPETDLKTAVREYLEKNIRELGSKSRQGSEVAMWYVRAYEKARSDLAHLLD